MSACRAALVRQIWATWLRNAFAGLLAALVLASLLIRFPGGAVLAGLRRPRAGRRGPVTSRQPLARLWRPPRDNPVSIISVIEPCSSFVAVLRNLLNVLGAASMNAHGAALQ